MVYVESTIVSLDTDEELINEGDEANDHSSDSERSLRSFSDGEYEYFAMEMSLMKGFWEILLVQKM